MAARKHRLTSSSTRKWPLGPAAATAGRPTRSRAFIRRARRRSGASSSATYGHGGGSDAAECAFDAPESKPFGPCQASDTYPLFCTAAEAEAMSPSNGHHMMAGLFMPNGVDPMCHGHYVGDATACECEDATKNDDGSDGAVATTLGYGAIAAAALLA